MIAKTRIRPKGKWIFGLGGITVFGSWWLVHEVKKLNHTLYQAMPVHVMNGLHKSPVYIYLPDDATNSLGLAWEGYVPTFSSSEGLIWQAVMSRTPWELIALARSDDRNHWRVGLKWLSSLKNLHPAFCRQIAQASDKRMAVGLARSQSADLRMLLPPPPFPIELTKSDVWQDLHFLLKSLPCIEKHKCINYLTALALQEHPFHQDELQDAGWWLDDGNKVKSTGLRKPSENFLGSLILEALQSHSTVEEHCTDIIQLKGLPILMKFYKSFKKRDSQHCSIIAEILGNLALKKEYHHHIFQAGWITVLAEWSRCSSLEVSLPAARALANLDNDNVKGCLENGIYLVHPQHWDNQTKILGDVVFVHGLLGGAFYTWRQGESHKCSAHLPEDELAHSDDQIQAATSYTQCWPKDWLAHDCPHLRILLVDYDTHITEWGRSCPYENESRSLEARSEEFLQKLFKAGIGERPVVWVSHSMGGLLVKEILLRSQSSPDPAVQQICKNTKGVVFYSVPHHGTSLANFHFGSQYLLLPSPEVRQLQLGSPKLRKLNDEFIELVRTRHISCMSFCESRKTILGNLRMTATFVTQDSADICFGEFHTIDADHLYICKPARRHSITYRHLAQFIHDQIGHSVKENFQHPIEAHQHTAQELEFIMGETFL